MTNLPTESDPLIPKENGSATTGEANETSHSSQHQQIMKSSNVYIMDETHGWLPAILIHKDEHNEIATVLYKDPNNKSKPPIERKIKLDQYGPSKSLPLQCVDDHGSNVVVEDMRDLPYSNEPSILYNLKDRYEINKTPYTRATSSVMVAINPYEWIDGLYADRLRREYADRIVWKANPKALALPPHLYEISSMALKGILTEDVDQTIVVSGESGAGKTVSSKILMAHLATFHESKAAYITQDLDDASKEAISVEMKEIDEIMEVQPPISFLQQSFEFIISLFSRKNTSPTPNNTEPHQDLTMCKSKSTSFDMESQYQQIEIEPEELKQKNLIVQRVIDSNPLLEAFGNAKTCLNDNSSRFSRYSKLQFHVEEGVLHPIAHIAGSTCQTFLLEKSRVVSHATGNHERSFHIFYQLMEASQKEKEKIWSGLVGKTGSSFKYIGDGGDHDEYTNRIAWNNTISALRTVGVVDSELQTLLSAVCIVLQLGNIIFNSNPTNEEEAVISNTEEFNTLSQMIGVDANDLAHCFTYKTMNAVHDTYQVPLKVADAKSTCDAFAKECYRAVFDWLVSKTNESTCADRNYKNAFKVDEYKCISVLDICGFECFEINGFEQLLINHANERLQKTFTETIIDSVMLEYKEEGLSVGNVEHENNDSVLRFLEGKLGLMSLLNEECIRPQGSDAGYVNKIYASHSTSSKASKLVFQKHYQLSKTVFGIKHFAKQVTYDATGFLMKNKDTLPLDVVNCAMKSSNAIISAGIQPNHSSGPKRKYSLTGASLWTSFERQLTALFTQIKKTRIWYVRCIIPNNQKLSFNLDLKCALSQLRSVGLLTALKMSHSSFPNKQQFEYILHRFWFLGDFGPKYAYGNIEASESSEMRKDCEKLLKRVLHSESDDSHVVGTTKVYFRSGSLEELEAKRAKAYDDFASKIQARVRGIICRKKFKSLRMILIRQRDERRERRERKLKMYFIPFALLPLYLVRYMFGSVKRPRTRLLRGSWH